MSEPTTATANMHSCGEKPQSTIKTTANGTAMTKAMA